MLAPMALIVVVTCTSDLTLTFTNIEVAYALYSTSAAAKKLTAHYSTATVIRRSSTITCKVYSLLADLMNAYSTKQMHKTSAVRVRCLGQLCQSLCWHTMAWCIIAGAAAS